jgi:hypothetical protein
MTAVIALAVVVVLLIPSAADAQTSMKRAIVGDANAIQTCELYVALADRMDEAGGTMTNAEVVSRERSIHAYALGSRVPAIRDSAAGIRAARAAWGNSPRPASRFSGSSERTLKGA